MPIKNQIDHRADYAKQKAAGQIVDVTAGRHGRSRPRLAVTLARARQRSSAQRPLAAEGVSLAEQLGIPIPEDVKQKVAQAAKLSETLTPPPTANVPETSKPEVRVDPPMGGGDLPPVAEMTLAEFGPPPAPLRPWVEETPSEPAEADRPEGEDITEADRPEGEDITETEPGGTPLV